MLVLFFLGMVIVCPLRAALPDPNQAVSAAFSSQAKLLNELRTVVQTLREERSSFYEKQRRIENRIEQKRDDLASLESKVTEVRTEEEQVDRDLERIEQDVKQLDLELRNRQANQTQVQKNMEDWIRKSLQAVDEGIPFRRQERRERLTPTVQESGASESPGAADALGRIWSFFQEEMRLARSGETFTKQMDIGNRRVKYARIFRVGQQILGYLTEDGEQTGLYLERNGQKQWLHHLNDDDDRAVRDAVEILDRRQPPKMISLPVSIRINRKFDDQQLEGENSNIE